MFEELVTTWKYLGIAGVCTKVMNRLSPNYSKYLKNEVQPTTEVMLEEIAHFSYCPTMSIIMPLYKPDIFELQEAVYSILEQPYEFVQLCLVDDGSNLSWLTAYLEELQQQYGAKVRVQINTHNQNISGASNDALALAQGAYVLLVDQDDKLATSAIYEVVRVLQEQQYDFIYSDEDMLDSNGKRHAPNFKPDWSPHTLLSMMYVNHLSVYKTELITSIGGFDSAFNGSQDYNLLLRASKSFQHVRHIPKILYHWRASELSIAKDIENKGYIYEKGTQVITTYLESIGLTAIVEPQKPLLMYDIVIPAKPTVQVGVVLMTTSDDLAFATLSKLLENNTVGFTHVYIVSETQKFPVTIEYLANNNIVLTFRAKLHLSEITSSHVLFIDDSVQFARQGILDKMLGISRLPQVGAISATTIDNTDVLLSAGAYYTNEGSIIASGFGDTVDKPGYYGRNKHMYNFSVLLTNILVEKANLPEDTLSYTDSYQHLVRICSKLRLNDLYNVNLGSVQVMVDAKVFKKKLMRTNNSVQQSELWGKVDDPFYNPNLLLNSQKMYQVNGLGGSRDENKL